MKLAYAVIVGYMLAVVVGEFGLGIKHEKLHNQFMLLATSEHWDGCEANRVLRAQINVTSDMSINAFHEFSNWGRDYLAEQPKCESRK